MNKTVITKDGVKIIPYTQEEMQAEEAQQAEAEAKRLVDLRQKLLNSIGAIEDSLKYINYEGHIDMYNTDTFPALMLVSKQLAKGIPNARWIFSYKGTRTFVPVEDQAFLDMIVPMQCKDRFHLFDHVIFEPGILQGLKGIGL